MASDHENSLCLALAGTTIGLWEWDVTDDRVRWVNDWCGLADSSARQPHVPRLRWSDRLHPADRAAYFRAVMSHLKTSGAPYDIEYRARSSSDAWVWVLERGRAIERNLQGHATRMVGLCMEVTEHHVARAALRKSHQQFQVAVWGTRVGFWELDVATGELTWWNEWYAAMDLDPCSGGPGARGWRDRVHLDDLSTLLNAHDQLLAGSLSECECEHRVRTRSGHWRWISTRARSVVDRQGRVARLAGVAMDIDARRRGETRLRAQSMVLQTMSEGVALIGKNQRVEYSNPAFEALRGNSPELMMNVIRSLARPMDACRAVPRSFSSAHGASPARAVTAEGISVPININGENQHLLVVQDVSERRRLETEILHTADAERRRLSIDLHDGIGQELTGIALLLRAFANTHAHSDQGPLEEIILLVNRAIQGTRQLAQGMSPLMVGRGGLIDALHSLTERARTHYAVDVLLRIKARHPVQLDETAANHLYLIAQEAIVNAVKHGRAHGIHVSLRVFPAMLQLSVSDDGIGFPREALPASGMGLKIMRYRSSLIGAHFHINRRARGGTVVQCTCPQPSVSAHQETSDATG